MERDNYRFFDVSSLKRTEGIEKRADENYIRTQLEQQFPNETFTKIKVIHNTTGQYKAKASLAEKLFGGGRPVKGLPEYIEVELTHLTGKSEEQLIVWSPVSWNDRFAGTAGGGTGIGGRGYLTPPSDTQRGWTLPYAVCNGFSAATMYAGNIEGWNDYTIDQKSGKLNRELYENWRLRSTHNMTVFGKTITEILHGRKIRYSYMNGGSGGGRQCLMEVQNYPEDYNGVWASCPAINWEKFLLAGFWPEVVMNEYGHFLSPEKNSFFLDAVHKTNGGPEAYYHLEEIPPFDFTMLTGQKVGRDVITETDARIMNEIVAGPHKRDGKQLWYGFKPGVRNWQKVIPIGTYYYPLFGKKVKPFILGPIVARWITETPKQDFRDIKMDDFEKLFEEGIEKFSDNLGDDPDIEKFAEAGGKLIIDHGIDDPLIPVDGTLDYRKKLIKHFGSAEKLDSFIRFYINPGDNHGNCWGNGPGITESAGLRALMTWVEEGKAPEGLRKVRVDQKTGELLEEGIALPYRKAE